MFNPLRGIDISALESVSAEISGAIQRLDVAGDVPRTRGLAVHGVVWLTVQVKLYACGAAAMINKDYQSAIIHDRSVAQVIHHSLFTK